MIISIFSPPPKVSSLAESGAAVDDDADDDDDVVESRDEECDVTLMFMWVLLKLKHEAGVVVVVVVDEIGVGTVALKFLLKKRTPLSSIDSDMIVRRDCL